MGTEKLTLRSKVFYCDGSYRDIYVRNTSESDWEVFIQFIRSEQLPIEMYKDGVRIEFDNLSPREIFNLTEQFAISMSILLDAVSIHCNFFTIDEIELDIDPIEVTNDYQFNRVTEFLVKLSNVMNKEVVLTPENCHDYIILKSLPNSNEIIYINID
jgi:hypothetical protein